MPFAAVMLFLLCLAHPIHGKSAEDYFSDGAIKASEGFTKEAISNYSAAIEINPGYTKAYYNRATAFLRLDRIDEALRDFNKVGLAPEKRTRS